MLEIEIQENRPSKTMAMADEGGYYGGDKENHEAYFQAMCDLETLVNAYEVMKDPERMTAALEMAKEQKSSLEGVLEQIAAVAMDADRQGRARERRQPRNRDAGRRDLRKVIESAMDGSDGEGES